MAGHHEFSNRLEETAQRVDRRLRPAAAHRTRARHKYSETPARVASRNIFTSGDRQHLITIIPRRYEERLQADMDRPYIDDGVHQFAQGTAAYRARWAKDATAYSGRVIAVPAPSGLGKTRMGLEYLETSAGLYSCLRNTYDSCSPILGWPPGAGPITALLERLHAYRYYHLAFVSAAVLAALMDAVCTTFQPSQTDALALHTAWRQYAPAGRKLTQSRHESGRARPE
ncbi:hypothetical protein DFH08DRAFT_804734 [Mycena albidolilacea]|uniref:Uncharacterized protein n=1 Tax=Mycena albidolilacea TaxID=1033008 RepID=A0AAD7AB03_9AGAR|nr:hypothetical protein DFH08DRAFT_804734 [Mycena albidolilacea]